MRRPVGGRGRRGGGRGLRPDRGHRVLDARVGGGAAGRVDARARGLELRRAPALRERQDVGAGDVALLLDGVRVEDGPYRPLRLGPDLPGAPPEPGARPQGLRLHVLGRHVGGVGRALAPAAAQARVLGHGLAAVEHRHGRGAEAHVDGPADQAVRHRVAHVVALHVVVRRHLAPPPLAPLEGRVRQRVQGGPLLAEEGVVAAAPAPGERAGVEGVDEAPHLRVQLLEGREPLVGERGEHPRLAQVDRLLRGRLVPRPPHARRHHGAAVALRRLEVGAVDLHRPRLAPAVRRGGAVVGHDDVRNAPGGLGRMDVRRDPGARPHVGEALGVHPRRPGERRDEKVRGRPPAGRRVEDRRGDPRPVDEHRPAGLARDARDEVVGPRVLPDLPAEARVAVWPLAARVTIGVARPLQRERHLRRPRELVADARVVGLEVLFAALPAAIGKEARGLRVGHRLEPGGVDPLLLHLRGAPSDGRLAAPEGAGGVVPAHPLQQLEHYLFLSGHAGLLPTGRAARLAALLLKGYWILGRYRLRGTPVPLL